MNAEQELIFAKLVLTKRLVSPEALKESLRLQTSYRGEGRVVELVEILRSRRTIGEPELRGAMDEFQRGLKQCSACRAFFHTALSGPATNGRCQRCSASGDRAPPSVRDERAPSVRAAPPSPAPEPPPVPAPAPPLASSRPSRPDDHEGPATEPEGVPIVRRPISSGSSALPAAAAAQALAAPSAPPPGGVAAPPPAAVPPAPAQPSAPSPAAAAASTDEKRLPAPRESFGDYEIVQVVARGGMGVVYKARHREVKRTVALKVLREGRRASDDHVTRFIREAKSVAKLSHPNIVRIHEFGHKQGQYFFTMDFIEGESFEAFLTRPGRDLRRGVGMVRDIAFGLAYAHEQGVIHRDVKPANILVDAEGRPHITDFGLARNVDHVTALTQEGELLGTPLYMSPEQVRGRVREVDARTDVYALGTILYQLLCGGRLPFQATTMVDLQWKVVNEDPEPPRWKHPEVPAALETICLKCLEKSREDRYQRAAELAEDLDRFLRGETVKARSLSTPGRVLRRVRRNRPLLIALGVVLLAIAGAVSAIIDVETRQRRRDEADALRRAADELDGATADALREVLAKLDAARFFLDERRPPEPAEALPLLRSAAARIAGAAAPDPRGLPADQVRAVLARHGLEPTREQVSRLLERVELTVRGESLLAAGDRSAAAEAVEAFGRALAIPGLGPVERLELTLLRGIAAAKAGQARTAIADLTEAIAAREREGDPPARALVHRGLAFWQEGDLARAVADLDRALRVDSGNPDAYLARGRFHLETGRYAIDFELARKDFDSAKQEDETIIEAYLGRAAAAYLLLDDEDAARDLAYVCDLASPFGRGSRPGPAEAVEVVTAVQVAEAARRLGRLCETRAFETGAGGRVRWLEAAKGAYVRALEALPDDAPALAGKARVLLQQGEVAEAAASAARAVALAPGDAAVLAVAAEVALARRPPAAEEALGFADRAVAAAPGYGDAHALRAEALWALGERAKAAEASAAAAKAPLERARAEGEPWRPSQTDVAYFFRQGKRHQALASRARAAPATGAGTAADGDPRVDLDLALRYFGRAAALTARPARARFERGWLFYRKAAVERDRAARKEHVVAALAELSAAIEANRFLADAYLFRGRIRVNDEGFVDYERAIADLDEAERHGAADYPDLYYQRGLAKLKRGDASAALEDLERAAAMSATLRDVYGAMATAHYALMQRAEGDRALEIHKERTTAAREQAGRFAAEGARHVEERRFEAAVEAFGKAIAFEPLGEHYHGRAVAHLGLGKPLEAVEDYARALERDPAHARHLYAYLGGFTQRLSFEEALARAAPGAGVTGGGAAAGPEPRAVDGNRAFLRGLLHFLRAESTAPGAGAGAADVAADLERGIDAFTAALDEQPALAAAYCLRGLLELRARNFKAAQDDLIVTVKLEPDSALAHFILAGVAAQKLGASDLPFEYLQKAIRFGFTDWEQMRREPSLEPLRLDPRWSRIVGR